MRLRAARRFIKKLYDSRQISTNWFSDLEDRGYYWCYRNKNYIFRVRVGRRVYASRSTCAFRCIKHLSQRLSCFSVYQGQVVDMNPAPTLPKLDFINNLKEKQCHEFPIVSAPNYGTISFLKGFTKHEQVTEALSTSLKILDDETRNEAVNEYVHTSKISDSTLLVPAFNKLATKPIKPLNRALLKRMIIINALSQAREKGKLVTKTLEFTPAKMASFDKNQNSASGILPVKPVAGVCGKVSGSKGDMHTAAVQVNIRDRIVDQIPCTIPFKPFFKNEVIKRGKPVRGIQNESYANYMILAMSSVDERLYHRGIAIGMGKKGEGLQMVFMYWYVIFKHETSLGWNDFLEFLNNSGAHESDKTAWEASTNATDGLAYVFCEANTKRFATPGDKRLYLRSLVDSCNPFIYVDRCGFWAPWRIPSGTFLTSKGNSQRHRLMNMAVVDYIKRHDNSIGLSSCTCEVCLHLTEKGFRLGHRVSNLLLRLRAHAFILGDDYIAVSMGSEQDLMFDTVMDFWFGTTTKTEFKQMFNSAEFLRRKFCVVNDMIFPYRGTTRAVAKLFHGEHTVSVERFCAALYSAMFEAGPNKVLQDFLLHLAKQLQPDTAVLTDELQAYKRKNPDLATLLPFYQFKGEDIINYFNRPLETLINVLRTVALEHSEEA